MTTISLIGTGNMGVSLLAGLIKNGHPPDKLWASDIDEAKLIDLQKTFHVHTTTDNARVVQSADVLIFAIKPQLFAEIATPLAPLIQAHQPLVISIAAGITESSITTWLGEKTAIVRAMPNTPALIGCGATALHANTFVSAKQRQIAESILKTVGLVVWLDQESHMDTVTALSGSGPAYFFLIMEALQQAAQELGLTPETARLLTLQTALGAARMAIENDLPLATLRHNVTSPGGTTEKALAVLEENNVRDLFRKTLEAAKLRSEELARLFGESKNA